jgi:uncharacterized membrane protein
MKYIFLVFTVITLIVTGVMYPDLTDQVPRHWDAYGNVDGYMAKQWLFALALLPAGIYYLFPIIRKVDPKSQNYERHEEVYSLFRLILSLMMFGVYYLSLFAATGKDVNIGLFMPILVGIIFVIIGNYMGKIKQNFFMGIRTPWTLSNENVWNKTHRFGGNVFVLMGLLLMLSSVLRSDFFVGLLLSMVVVMVVGLFLYSYIIFRKENGGK